MRKFWNEKGNPEINHLEPLEHAQRISMRDLENSGDIESVQAEIGKKKTKNNFQKLRRILITWTQVEFKTLTFGASCEVLLFYIL